MKRLTIFFTLLLIALVSATAVAQEKPEFIVAFGGIKAFKGFDGEKKLNGFVKDFLTRDERYQVVDASAENATHTLAVAFKKEGNGVAFSMKAATAQKEAGAAEAEYNAELPKRFSLAQAEAEIMRGIRTLLPYKAKRRQVLIKIKAEAAEGDADAGIVEDAIYQKISEAFELVPANPYELPVKDENVPALLKGEKAPIKVLREKSPTDILIAGTVSIPKTKNVGGATENNYKGTANVHIRVWDIRDPHMVSEVKLTLNGQGMFSELVYMLITAAAEKSAGMIAKDLGLKVSEQND